ncbi:phosphatase PAP2 family protein, partial [Escherichia coli]
IRCVCGKKIGPDPRNFNQRVSLGRNDLLIRTFHSFPGDHGMMLLIFSAFMWRYFGKVAGLIALIIFVVFAFPRVMIGAHWFTDIIVGSMTVILIGLPWVLLTPLSDRLITFFDKSLPGKNKHFQNK